MDLTQDIFIAVLRALDSYDPHKAGLRTWIYRIATNLIIDHRRSKSAKDNACLCLDNIPEWTDASFEIDFEQRELLRRIEKYINTFDFTAQQIFRLHVFSDWTFAQIAEGLEKSESTVKTAYYRLLKEIRKEFSDEF